MDSSLNTSFARKHSTSDAKLGHVNKPIIMSNTILERNSLMLRYMRKICYACAIGLARNYEREYSHALPDFIFTISKEDKKIAFAEINCKMKVCAAQLD